MTFLETLIGVMGDRSMSAENLAAELQERSIADDVEDLRGLVHSCLTAARDDQGRHVFRRVDRAVYQACRWSPRGTLLIGAPADGIPPGTLVVVTGATGLDGMCEGRSGELLGYSVPHGYAVLAWQDRELLVHPESLANLIVKT